MGAQPRVLVASPHKFERELLADWLVSEGMQPVCVASAVAALHGVSSRMYELLVTDAGFAFADGLYAATRGRTSEIPAIVVGEAGGLEESRAARHGAMFVPRPIDRTMLMCSVTMALVDGRTPRRSPRKAVGRCAVSVDGMPSQLVDVSYEGLRVEFPLRGGPSPAPIFVVHVPMLGVALSVHRVWVSGAPTTAAQPTAWCGAALGRNSSRAESSWRAFVASIPGAA